MGRCTTVVCSILHDMICHMCHRDKLIIQTNQEGVPYQNGASQFSDDVSKYHHHVAGVGFGGEEKGCEETNHEERCRQARRRSDIRFGLLKIH